MNHKLAGHVVPTLLRVWHEHLISGYLTNKQLYHNSINEAVNEERYINFAKLRNMLQASSLVVIQLHCFWQIKRRTQGVNFAITFPSSMNHNYSQMFIVDIFPLKLIRDIPKQLVIPWGSSCYICTSCSKNLSSLWNCPNISLPGSFYLILRFTAIPVLIQMLFLCQESFCFHLFRHWAPVARHPLYEDRHKILTQIIHIFVWHKHEVI